MTVSQNGAAKSHSPPMSAQETSVCEDEIDLRNYFRIILKRKYFIALASVLPALAFGLIVFLWPGFYKVTYIYDVDISAKQYRILLDRFYCSENLDKIITRLKESGLDEYAQSLAQTATDKHLKKLVNFEISPLSAGAATPSKAATPERLLKTQEGTDTLLAMTIVGKPGKDMQKISLIIRDSLENVIPIYSVKQELSETIAGLRTRMAGIEQGGFALVIELEGKKATLLKLKNLKPQDFNEIPTNITLQFSDMAANSTYLPLAYQIQAVESGIINLEENIKTNQDQYNYCKDLLWLNEKILEQISNKTSLHYTIQEFHSFLTAAVDSYESNQLTGYLNAYITKTENMISMNVPLVEKPKIYSVPRGTVRKTLLAFVVLLIAATVAAFAAEGARKARAHTAKEA